MKGIIERDQKYKAEFRDIKFKGKDSKAQFEKWLEKNTKYKVEFKDNGQDCLGWYLDKGGEVLHADMQAAVWNGKLVSLYDLAIGKGIGYLVVEKQATQFTDFIVKKITIKNGAEKTIWKIAKYPTGYIIKVGKVATSFMKATGHSVRVWKTLKGATAFGLKQFGCDSANKGKL